MRKTLTCSNIKLFQALQKDVQNQATQPLWDFRASFASSAPVMVGTFFVLLISALKRNLICSLSCCPLRKQSNCMSSDTSQSRLPLPDGFFSIGRTTLLSYLLSLTPGCLHSLRSRENLDFLSALFHLVSL